MRVVNTLLLPGGSRLLLTGCIVAVKQWAATALWLQSFLAHGRQVHAWLHEGKGASCSRCVVPASCLRDVILPVPMKSCMGKSLVQGSKLRH